MKHRYISFFALARQLGFKWQEAQGQILLTQNLKSRLDFILSEPIKCSSKYSNRYFQTPEELLVWCEEQEQAALQTSFSSLSVGRLPKEGEDGK